MVKTIEKERRKYFQCESCRMYYPSKDLAEKCEDFCRKHKSCNTDIIKHSVEVSRN